MRPQYFPVRSRKTAEHLTNEDNQSTEPFNKKVHVTFLSQLTARFPAFVGKQNAAKRSKSYRQTCKCPGPPSKDAVSGTGLHRSDVGF